MKRILALVLIITLCLFALVSCDLFPEKKRVSCKEYKNCAVFTLDYFEGSYSVELSRTGLGEGAIYYQINLEHGRLTVNYKDAGFIHSEQPLGDFTADDEMPIISSGGYIEGDKIEISFGTLSPVKGEIIIAFTEDALNDALESTQHEHTITYVSAGEAGHFENYTCGCPHDHGAVPHYDEDIDLICDACGYDMNADYPPLVDETVSLAQFASWLTELNAESVAEIKTTFEYVGVAPGTLKDISRTTDKTVIADVLEKYASVEMRPVAPEETYIDGGSAFTIEFTLTDGTVKQLHFNNGFYAYGLDEIDISALRYFELCSIPTLKDYDNVTKSNGFITYIGTGEVYDKDNNLVCEIPIDELEFDYDLDLDLPDLPPYDLAIRTEFGDLKFIAPDIFYMETGEACVLVGKNLDELIAYATSAE
nr:hypothetical protein [Clostridia bacterium]